MLEKLFELFCQAFERDEVFYPLQIILIPGIVFLMAWATSGCGC